MDVRGDSVITASKDGTVVCSRLAGSRLARLHSSSPHGGSVVKCARWRDSASYASCGNDWCACSCAKPRQKASEHVMSGACWSLTTRSEMALLR